MPEHAPISAVPAADFLRRLARATQAVFMLDYDGTLAPFQLDVHLVRPYPGVSAALDALAATGRARVIIVTGRYLKQAPPRLGTRIRPEIWGSHGRERLQPDGRYEVATIDEAALRALTLADSWCAAVERAGGHCEAKPGSLAFHWRGATAAQAEAIRALVRGNFARETLGPLLEMRDFDGGIELRAPGADKGAVVRTILRETPAGAPVAYLGDDLTDEDAFRALRGRGLGVLVRPEARATAADLWVRPPEGLLALLHDWCAALGRSPA